MAKPNTDNFLNLQMKELQGLLPAIDPRTVEKPFVIEGRNFRFDLKGPFSGFGSFLLTKAQLFNPELAKSFRLNDTEIVYCLEDSILKYDNDGMIFYPVYLFTPSVVEDWPWSHAEVSSRHYFCKKGVGVIEFDTFTDEWTLLSDPAIPTDPVGVAQCRGRLIILGSSGWAWSALGTGTDLTPSLNTGAGNQGISIIGGTPLGVFGLEDVFEVFTTKGIAISEFSGGQATPFRHRVLTNNEKAINPFCIIELETGLIVFLDIKGLRQTTGQKPTVYQPLFSEYLARTLLPSRNLRGLTIFRLEYSGDKQLLFLSVASDGAPTKYDLAYVLYRPLTDKWGVFNEQHRSFVEIFVDSGPGIGFSFGFVDEQGYFHVFSEDIFREETDILTDPLGIFWRPEFDLPGRIGDGIYYAPSMITINAYDDSIFETRLPNWYLIEELFHREIVSGDSEVASSVSGGVYTAAATLVMEGSISEYVVAEFLVDRASLDSYIIVGPFRFSEMKYADQLGQVTNLTLSVEALGSQSIDEDWMDMPEDVEEDWMNASPDEDWGGLVTDHAMFTAIIRGTNDAVTVFGDNEEELINFRIDGTEFFFPCTQSVGLYQIVEINAQGIFDNYHLTYAELSGTTAGRL